MCSVFACVQLHSAAAKLHLLQQLWLSRSDLSTIITTAVMATSVCGADSKEWQGLHKILGRDGTGEWQTADRPCFPPLCTGYGWQH